MSLNSLSKKPDFLKWCFGLSLLLLLIAFRSAELTLFKAWQTEEYSHGFFIPIIALLMIGHFLAEKRPILNPSWLCIPFLIISTFLLLVTSLSAFEMTAQYGLILGFLSLSLAFGGRDVTKCIFPALFYLIFAVPLPHLLQANLSQDLQLLSSTLGVWPLDAMGIPVYQEGNIIDLGGYRLQVVEACNGLRYLFPLMSFGYLVGVLLKDAFWKKVVLFLSTIPISIGLNSLRIAIIGITVDLWGQKMAEGFIHAFEGWVVFVICLALLLLETKLLLRIGAKKGEFRYDYITLPSPPFFGGQKDQKTPAFAELILVAILALIFGSGAFDQFPNIVPPHPAFATFPTQLGDWKGKQERLAPDVLQMLQLNQYWLADYTRIPQEPPVNFYIAYYDSQRVGATTHSPSNCIPGGGWQIAKSEIITVPLKDGTQLSVTRLIIRKDHDAELAYYWFDERGRDLTETTYAKWYLLWDSITMHRTDGALVRLVVPLADANNETQGDETLKDFLDDAYPVIKSFIPGANLASNRVSY